MDYSDASSWIYELLLSSWTFEILILLLHEIIVLISNQLSYHFLQSIFRSIFSITVGGR